MKKVVITTVFLAGLVLLTGKAAAFTYTIPDTTLVPRSDNGVLVDRIGTEVFEIYGIDYSWSGSDLNFSIYTNYPEEGKDVGSWYTRPGHFGVDADRDGAYEFGLVLSGHDFDGLTKGDLYSVSSWYSSTHYKPSGGYIHGLFPVTIESGSVIDTSLDPIIIVWNTSTKDGEFQIDFSIDGGYLGLAPGDFFDFRWAVANCANEVIQSPIPEPTTLLLFASGLLGIFLRRRSRKS